MSKAKKVANTLPTSTEFDGRVTSLPLSLLTRAGAKIKTEKGDSVPVNIEDIPLSNAARPFLCLSVSRSAKVKETSKNVVSIILTKDAKKGDTVLALVNIAAGAKHVPDIQDAMVQEEMGTYGAEELAARALRVKHGKYAASRDWGAFIKLSEDGESLTAGKIDVSLLLEPLVEEWEVDAATLEAWTLQALQLEKAQAVKRAEQARKKALEESGQA
tara:strand:- start:13602 stop:14249 length:648 start_codon:yes stop_codon:yes gene_type:complete